MSTAGAGAMERAPLPVLGEVLDFMRLLWEVDHALQRTSKHMERTVGVTGPQRLVVRIVGRLPGITAGLLAGLLHVHPSTLTGILNRLERHGLVRRRPDPRDGRRLLLGLTARGRLFDVETAGTVETAIERALADSSADELRATRRVLASVAKQLAHGEPAGRRGPASRRTRHRSRRRSRAPQISP